MNSEHKDPRIVEVPLDLLLGWTRAVGLIPAEHAAELYISMKHHATEALASQTPSSSVTHR